LDQPSDIFPIGAYSCRFGRTEWYHVLQQLLGVSENRPLFELLKSSAVAVALEGESPATASELIDDIRGDTDSANRYSDQTLTLVVYSDGTRSTWLAFEHSTSDTLIIRRGGALC
jgi:hypothetical protein